MQNRHFVCVVDPEIKTKLSVAAWGQEQVRDASVVIVLTGNRNAYKNTDRYLRNAPPAVRQNTESMIVDLYGENDALARDEDCRSVSLAGMNIMLMATDMGYESGPMIGFDPEQVSEILGLPDDHAPLLLIVIGRGTRPPRERLGLLNFEELVSVDRFGQNSITGAVEADNLSPDRSDQPHFP
jgi:nitroreductase